MKFKNKKAWSKFYARKIRRSVLKLHKKLMNTRPYLVEKDFQKPKRIWDGLRYIRTSVPGEKTTISLDIPLYQNSSVVLKLSASIAGAYCEYAHNNKAVVARKRKNKAKKQHVFMPRGSVCINLDIINLPEYLPSNAGPNEPLNSRIWRRSVSAFYCSGVIFKKPVVVYGKKCEIQSYYHENYSNLLEQAEFLLELVSGNVANMPKLKRLYNAYDLLEKHGSTYIENLRQDLIKGNCNLLVPEYDDESGCKSLKDSLSTYAYRLLNLERGEGYISHALKIASKHTAYVKMLAKLRKTNRGKLLEFDKDSDFAYVEYTATREIELTE